MDVHRLRWHVKIDPGAEEFFKKDVLSDDDKLVLRKWAQTIIEHGPEELQTTPSVWADHALYGEWLGYRASSFSHRGRIIYRVERQIVTVVVVKLTATHDYQKE